MTQLNIHMFRAYDIRGVYGKDIDPTVFYQIGLSAGTYVQMYLHGSHMMVGNDLRTSSAPLVHAFLAGVSATGIKTMYAGTTSFGQTLFQGGENQSDLIAFITASHLPAEWNGVKFYYGDGVGLPEDELMKIRDITLDKRWTIKDWKEIGSIGYVSPVKSYEDFFQSSFSFSRPIRIALDCGGASMTLSAPSVLQNLGLDVVEVYCDPDPTFSVRPSDPKPENLETLIKKVKEEECDFGVAFDGDGDRSVIVDDQGFVLSADQTGIILGKYGLENQKGTIIANVECSKSVEEQLSPLGFTIKKIQVGHTFLTLHAKKEDALLGIESSGHLIIPKYFLFDDALVVPLKIAEILDSVGRRLSDIRKEIPIYPRKKLEIECDDSIKFEVIDQLQKELSKHYDDINTLDGVRVNLDEGWVLIRASNTSPIIRLTSEADTEQKANDIAGKFKQKTEETIDLVSS